MKKTITSFICICIFLFSILSITALSANIKLGIDVLIENNFNQLEGKRIALVTNHAGRTSKGNLSIEEFLKTKTCTLTTIFTPEHGFYTTIPAGETVINDTIFGLPMISLYGSNRRPTRQQLSGLDAVVIDIQDIGIRSYTYISTVLKCMDACAEYGKPIYILDRPNPLGGISIDGNVVEKDFESFIGIAPIPYIHGLTVGEFALMANGEGWLTKNKMGIPRKCNLTVIKMEGWNRWMDWEDTGLQWYPTSPHIPTVDAARGAAMLGFIGELGMISTGIGTTLPFQYIGAPDFNIEDFTRYYGSLNQDGVKLIPSRFRPFYGKYSGKDCNGFLLKLSPDNLFEPYTAGIKTMLVLRKLMPNLFKSSEYSSNAKDMFKKATGTDKIFNGLMSGLPDREIISISRTGIDEYKSARNKYLLYK